MIRNLASLLAASSCALLLSLAPYRDAQALALGADFVGSYSVTSLGSVPGLPASYGGLTFLNPNKLLIGGDANTAQGLLYTIDLVRDGSGHITGFSNTAVAFGTVGAYNDGGVVFGPGGVLFTARWPVNQLGQTKPGSTVEDKIVDLGPLGVAVSHAALNFVPTGFGGAGKLKLVSWEGGEFYDIVLAPDGLGTYNVVSATQVDLDPVASGMQTLPGGPEGFVYIAGGNPGFSVASMLVSEYSADKVGAFEIDLDGNPMVSTRRDFLTGLTGAEGATIDPLTGDFLFSTFGGADQIVLVRGFTVPPPTCGQPGQPPCGVPEPGTLPLLMVSLLAGLSVALRRRWRAAR